MNPPLHKGFAVGYENCHDYLDGLGERNADPAGRGADVADLRGFFWDGISWIVGKRNADLTDLTDFFWCVVKEAAWRQIGVDFLWVELDSRHAMLAMNCVRDSNGNPASASAERSWSG